ncbi:hypothetical protein ACFFUU_09625 [Flavobacterium paronense]|uniref:Glycosyltransferase RgtA/B/C/D-like domain-containing protein n=2 Tax=Flavobacterium paronense TaxID=1392775 RepID=A0ABV5GFF8_9FLAO
MINLKLTEKFFLIILFCSLFTSFLFKSFINNELISNILVAFNSLLILLFIFLSIKNDIAKFLIFIFFLLRVFLLYIDYYGKAIVSILHSGGDTERFYIWGMLISKDLSLMNEITYTRYTDFLGILYWIIGDQRLFSQFINVILGTWSIFVLYKILDLFSFKDSKKLFFLAIYGLYPQNIIFSSILLREGLIQFFFIYSIYFFTKWVMTNDRVNMFKSIIFVLLSSLFHSGMIISLLVYVYIFLFLDVKKNRFNYSLKRLSLFFLLFGMSFAVIANDSSILNGKFSILQTDENNQSLIEKYQSNSGIEEGGSTYLKGYKMNSAVDFITFVPLKLIYFILSPMPYDVRGLGDIIAILIDSSFYYFLIYKIIRSRKIVTTNFRIFPKIFLILFLTVSLGFALGTENSGTAMRHRAKIYPALIMVVVLIESIKQNKKSIWDGSKII